MRQVNEGVRIACCVAVICVNSKMLFHQPAIVRVTASLGNSNDDQTVFNFQPGGRSGDRWRGERRDWRGRGLVEFKRDTDQDEISINLYFSVLFSLLTVFSSHFRLVHNL